MIEKNLNEIIKVLSEKSDSEKNIAEFLRTYTKRSSAICCGGAESGLDIILYTLGIGRGDAVFVSAIAPVFVVSSLLKADAHIVFCDITAENPGMDHLSLEKKIKEIIFDGDYEPRAIIMSESFGYMPRVDEIEKISTSYGLVLIEDASEGFGGSFNGRKAGSFGDVSVVGFNTPLWQTVGRAGAILTDHYFAEKLSVTANGGVPVDSIDGLLCCRGGTYSKIHPLDAVIIESELDTFDMRRQINSERYAKAAEIIKNDGTAFKSSSKYTPSHSYFPIVLKGKNKREQITGTLAKHGFSLAGSFPLLPVCLHPALEKNHKINADDCPKAKKIWENLLII